MRGAGFDPSAMRTSAELALLPPLTRAEIIAHAKSLVSTAYDPSRLVVHRSGGTTSEPVPFFQSRESLMLKNGAADALRRRMGWGPGDRSAWLWGATRDMPREAAAPSDRRSRPARAGPRRSLYLPRGTSDARLDAYADKIRVFRPAALQGYPSATDLLARRLLDRGQRLHVPLVVLTAEPSNRGQRRRIGEALEAEVLTFYGARECGWIASECRAQRRLHVNTAGIHLEATADGRLLVTDLWNPAMPLVRYEIGDRGLLDETPCPCGDPRPVLARLEGREVDVFTLPSGRRVPGVLSDVRGVGFDAHGILDAQFIQNEIGRLDVHWVPGADHAPNDLEAFRHHVSELFFGELEVVFHREERIQPGPNGKVRHCISRVTAAALRGPRAGRRRRGRQRVRGDGPAAAADPAPGEAPPPDPGRPDLALPASRQARGRGRRRQPVVPLRPRDPGPARPAARRPRGGPPRARATAPRARPRHGALLAGPDGRGGVPAVGDGPHRGPRGAPCRSRVRT
jgi:phenylacetate-CoA ligase